MCDGLSDAGHQSRTVHPIARTDDRIEAFDDERVRMRTVSKTTGWVNRFDEAAISSQHSSRSAPTR